MQVLGDLARETKAKAAKEAAALEAHVRQLAFDLRQRTDQVAQYQAMFQGMRQVR